MVFRKWVYNLAHELCVDGACVIIVILSRMLSVQQGTIILQHINIYDMHH